MTIFKLQRPVACTPGAEREIYAYNEDRKIFFQGPVNVKTMRKLFPQDEYKVFQYGYLDKEGVLTLTGEAPWQDW